MSKIKFSFIISIFSTLIFSSCKKPEKVEQNNQQQTTVKEDKDNVLKIQDDVVNGISSMRRGQVVSSIKETTKLSQGEMDSEWLDSVFLNFERDAFDIEDIENNNRLILSSHAGIYTYVKADNSWKKTSNSSAIIVKFPSTKETKDNNLTFELSQYQDKLYTIDGEQYGVPTKLSMSFKKNNNTLMSFNINSLIFDQDDNIIVPTNINATLFLSPFTMEMLLTSKNSGKTFNGSIKLYNNNGFSSSLSSTLDLTHNNYSLIEDEDIDNITASLKVNSAEIKGDADINTLIALDDPSETQINSLVDIDILNNNQKVADVLVGEDYPELVYKDGSKELVDEDYIQRFIDKVEIEVVNELGQID